LRRTLLLTCAGSLICLCAGVAGAGDAAGELRFAEGLKTFGYYDLAAERFRLLDWRKQADAKLRLTVAEGLIESYLAAAREGADFAERHQLQGQAAAEMAALVGTDLPDRERFRLFMKQGEIFLDYGRLSQDVLQRKPRGVDLAKIAAEGDRAYRGALAAFRKGSNGYKGVVKRIEEKSQVNDADRRLRQEMLLLQIVGETQTGWARFQLARFFKEQKKTSKFQSELKEAAKVFGELSAAHSDIVAGISATLGKGLCLQELGNHKGAIAAFDQVLRVKPSRNVAMLRFQAIYERAASQAALKEYEAAIESLEKARSEFGRLPQDLADGLLLRHARTLGRAADDRAAQEKKSRAEAGRLKKEGDHKGAADLNRKADKLKKEYAGLYDKAVRRIRPLTMSDSVHAQEATLLLGKWMAAAGITQQRTGADSFAEGERLFAAGKHLDAVTAYRSVIRESGDKGQGRKLSHDAWIQMGKAFAEAGRYYEGGLALGHAARLYPESPYAEKLAAYGAMLLGAAYQKGKSEVESEAYFESQDFLVRNFPDNEAAKRAAFRLGDVLRTRKKYEAAADCYENVGQASQYYERASYLAGWCWWEAFVEEQGERSSAEAARPLMAKAEKQLRRFVRWAGKQPKAPAGVEAERRLWTAKSRLLLAEMLLFDGRNAEILAHEEVLPDKSLGALAALPGDLAALHTQARIHRLRALTSSGGNAGAYAAEAEMKALLSDKFIKTAELSAAARLLGSTFVLLAQELKKKDEAPQAELRKLSERAGKYLRLSIERNPEQSLSEYQEIASGLYQAGMYGEAASTFGKLISKYGKSTEHAGAVRDARIWVGRSYMKAGEWKFARSEFEKLVRDMPEYTDLRRNLALCCENLQLYDKATTEWRRLEEKLRQGTDPWFEARLHRISMLAELGRKDPAFQMLAGVGVAYPNLGGPKWEKQFLELLEAKFDQKARKSFEDLRRGKQPAAP